MKQEYFVNIKYDNLHDVAYIHHTKLRILTEFLMDYPFNKKYILKWSIDKNNISIINNTKYIKFALSVKIK